MFEEKYFRGRNPELEPKHEYEVRRIIRHFGLVGGDKIFVHGCGYGQRLHWFLKLGMNAWGMDVSEYAMYHAYGEAKNKIFDMIPANPISKYWYDLVVSIDVLEHIDDAALVSAVIKLANLSTKAIYGITFKNHKNFPKDSTHINGKTKEEWIEFLLNHYDRVYEAPQNWVGADMYLLCMRIEK